MKFSWENLKCKQLTSDYLNFKVFGLTQFHWYSNLLRIQLFVKKDKEFLGIRGQEFYENFFYILIDQKWKKNVQNILVVFSKLKIVVWIWLKNISINLFFYYKLKSIFLIFFRLEKGIPFLSINFLIMYS